MLKILELLKKKEVRKMKFNIKTDSRRVVDGDIFVALKMVNGDGHDYIPQAIQNGAKTIVCTHGEFDGAEVFHVDDTRKYLEDYLIDHYKKYIDEMTVIAFTGTNGKSTSVHLMYQALNKLGHDCASIGTVGFFMKEGKVRYLANTSPDIGEMYELLMTAYEAGYRYVALEASSHGFALNRLNGITYSYASFSNLTRDHLDFHKTFENYAACKRKLFERLRPNGLAMVNYDDPYCDYFLLPENRNLTYGFNGGDIQVIDYDMSMKGTHFTIQLEGKPYEFYTPILGKYNVSNMLPIIMILHDMGIEMEKIQEIIPTLEAPDGRIEVIPYGTNNIIIDYAHTPDGMEKVINTVNELTVGDTYVVFCCRGNRDRPKRPMMMKAATELTKFAIVTQDNFFGEPYESVIEDMLVDNKNTNYEICLDRKEAIHKGIDLLNENDSLLVLGKGHEDYLYLPDGRKIHFYDKEEILDYIKQKQEA